jgi:hypothetical protein
VSRELRLWRIVARESTSVSDPAAMGKQALRVPEG